MKACTFILTVAISLILMAGCTESMTVEAMRSQRTDLKARTLFPVAEGIEVGPVLSWTNDDDVDWGPEPSGVGLAIKVPATWVIGSTDTGPEAIPPFKWAENLELVPYALIEWIDLVDNDKPTNLEPQYGLGLDMYLGEHLSLFTEYQTGDLLPDDTALGIRGVIPF